MHDTYKNEPAIYIFTNKVNGKKYVGMSMDLKRRMVEYQNPKPKRPFEKALLKYGFNGFDLEIHYYPDASPVVLAAFECSIIMLMESLTTQHGYNVCVYGSNRKGYKHREESKLKISQANKGKQNWRKGIPHTDETRNKMSESKASKRKSVEQYTISGDFIKGWESLSEAARTLGLHKTNISNCALGKTKWCGGYKWKFTTPI